MTNQTAHAHDSTSDGSDHEHGHSHLHKEFICILKILKEFIRILKTLIGLSYPIPKAFIDAYIITELIHFIMNHEEFNEKIENSLYWSGFFLSLVMGLMTTVAIFYYKNKMEQENAAEECEHGHGHSHEHTHNHSWSHFFAEFFGLIIFNFAVAIGGIYYACLGEKSPANNTELIRTAVLMTLGGIVYTYGETQIHHFFLKHSEKKDGNFLLGFIRIMFTDIGTLYQEKGFSPFLAKHILLRWGSFLSHISSAIFSIGAALMALQLISSTTFPLYIIGPASLLLIVLGSMVHNNSELQAYIDNGADVGTLFPGKNCLQKIFLTMCLALLIFHVLPEAIGIPELITSMIPNDVALLWRVVMVLGFVSTLGAADLVVNTALMIMPLNDLVTKLPLLMDRSNSEERLPIFNSHSSIGGNPHIQEHEESEPPQASCCASLKMCCAHPFGLARVNPS